MLLPILIASGALATAQTTTRSNAPTTTGEPCAQISLYSSIPAEIAYQCLQSVPVDVESDQALIEELKLAWAWNSEYAYLKKMPEDWEFGSLDIEDELNKIKNGLSNFKSEYDVQRAIQNITYRTGNYHFNYNPDILQVFDWSREIGVVSLSKDGKDLPKLYLDSDAYRMSSGKEVSEITKINDEDAYAYLGKIGTWGQYVDSDGRLNKLFTKGDTQRQGTFESQIHYDGSTTKITFANGNETIFENYAYTVQDFEGITDGPSFYNAFCKGQIASMDADGLADDHLQTDPYLQDRKSKVVARHLLNKRQISNSSYTTVIEADSGAVMGYFLNGDGYSDVAVLKILSFDPTGDSSGMEFQATIKYFLEQCILEKKEKLIIDLRENGGGAPSLVLDAFMQLFPEQEPFSAQHYRADEQWVAIGEAVSEIYTTPALNSKYNKMSYYELAEKWRFWAYWHFVTAKGENFKDWQEYLGPEQYNGDTFTALSRYNYSNEDRISIVVEGFYFINGTNRPTPFKPENIVMFTDALCGSACAGIHEELKNIAGVKSVTVGGRPQNAPIQAVTGSKGSEVLRVGRIPDYAADILSLTRSIGAKVPTSERLVNVANATQIPLRAGDQRTRIQTQDQLRKGDTTATPLEFIYEAADCRFFYTAATYADTDAAWKAAWDVYTDETKCVEGSTKHKSSISGGYVPFGPGELTDDQVPKPNQTTDNPSNPTGGAKPSGSSAPKSTGMRVRVGSMVLCVTGVLMMVMV